MKKPMKIFFLIFSFLFLSIIIIFIRNDAVDPDDVFEDLAKERGINNFYIQDSILYDSVEKSPQFINVISDVKQRANRKADEFELQGSARNAFVDGEIRKILKNDYDIEWRSVSEMNPWLRFSHCAK